MQTSIDIVVVIGPALQPMNPHSTLAIQKVASDGVILLEYCAGCCSCANELRVERFKKEQVSFK